MACGDPLGTYYAHVTQVIKNKHVLTRCAHANTWV